MRTGSSMRCVVRLTGSPWKTGASYNDGTCRVWGRGGCSPEEFGAGRAES